MITLPKPNTRKMLEDHNMSKSGQVESHRIVFTLAVHKFSRRDCNLAILLFDDEALASAGLSRRISRVTTSHRSCNLEKLRKMHPSQPLSRFDLIESIIHTGLTKWAK